MKKRQIGHSNEEIAQETCLVNQKKRFIGANIESNALVHTLHLCFPRRLATKTIAMRSTTITAPSIKAMVVMLNTLG
jgi:hypothetical protein